MDSPLIHLTLTPLEGVLLRTVIVALQETYAEDTDPVACEIVKTCERLIPLLPTLREEKAP